MKCPKLDSGAASGQQRYRLDNLARFYIKSQACRGSSGARFAQSGLCRGFVFAGQRQYLRCPSVVFHSVWSLIGYWPE